MLRNVNEGELLRRAIHESGEAEIVFSIGTGIADARIDAIAHGAEPTDLERRRIAAMLTHWGSSELKPRT